MRRGRRRLPPRLLRSTRQPTTAPARTGLLPASAGSGATTSVRLRLRHGQRQRQCRALLLPLFLGAVLPLFSVFFFCAASAPAVADAFPLSSPLAGGRSPPSSTCWRRLAQDSNGDGAEGPNPLSSLVSKVMMRARVLGMSSASSASCPPEVDGALERLAQEGILPSWSEVRSLLESQMAGDELAFRSNLELGYGAEGSPLHKLRLYSSENKPQDVRVVFYRDSASWCPYCQKVWIALEEKRVPYRVEKVNMRCYGDKTAEFVRMQPSGQIPVAEIDGKVYGQSNDILYALEEKFPGRPLLPPPEDAEATDRARRLLRLERELFSAWLSWLTGRSNNKSAFVSVLQRVENELGATTSGPFFLEGDEMSLVDVMYAPFLERMAASLCYYKGFVMRVSPGASTPYPNVNRWFDGMERHPSYRLTKSDYYTHAWDLPPQLGGCQREPAGEPFEAAINGESDHWRLPLEPDLGGIEPDWTWISPEQARRQAVERVSGNHEAIVKFASRGAGSPGFPGVSAPLADPNAVPNLAVAGSVDALMKIVCAAILQGADSQQDALDRTVRSVAWGEGGGDNNGNSNNKGRGESRTDEAFARGVVASLRYVRDRVGVPRDMTLPAARQLRAHLNWAIDAFARAGVS